MQVEVCKFCKKPLAKLAVKEGRRWHKECLEGKKRRVVINPFAICAERTYADAFRFR